MKMDNVTKLTFSKQEHLLQYSIREGTEFSDVLESHGYTYEDLRYRCNDLVNPSNAEYHTLADYAFSFHGIPALSLFSGAGGLDLGFKYAGFSNLASFEINAVFCETLVRNHPKYQVFGPPHFSGDIRNRESIASILTNELGIRAPFEGIFHGGPPCQSFSIASNQRFAKWGNSFKRIGFEHEDYGPLLFDFIWYIREFRPRVFLLENVPGILTIDCGEQWSKAMKLLAQSGYEIAEPIILDSRFYGVPQSRKRLFACGWHICGKTYELPAEDFVGVPCYKAFKKPVAGLPNHVIRKHKASSILRYMELKYGERDYLGRVDRLNPNLPSKTVIAGGTGGGGRSHLHPFIPRTLSPRETARLQTFPDDYIFCGSAARQLTQVGNAVPPVLAMKLARSIYESLYK